jgi:hypothetical protein
MGNEAPLPYGRIDMLGSKDKINSDIGLYGV